VPAAGDVLGRYELVEEIGEGGMATVFRARDRELRRDVAIKVMFPHLAKREETVHRFQREARAAAGLEHPNILRVYDVGDAPPFIVMELVRGRTLLAEIELRGAMLAELAACVGALLADALAAAHKAGVIHRDVKPANVLIASDGRVLLADFGVARLETSDSLVTRSGALLGTPAYMSPEQASGDIATARSDLYSLGATLYQLATGALPYAGTPAKVMSQIATGQLVAPVRRRAAVGPDLSRAIERLMQSEPEARPASADSIAGELRELAAAAGIRDPAGEVAAYFADPDGFVRARTPAIVERVIAATEQALDGRKLPRALALADRASALAPDDVRVKALVERALAGGRSGRRRKVLALGLAGLAVVGGLAAGALWMQGSGASATIADGSRASDARAVDAVTPDAEPRDAAIEDAAVDATVRPRAAERRDAAPAVVPLALDATPEPPSASDAAVPAADDRAASIVVDSDAWCDVSIDDKHAGRNRDTLAVSPGHHVVRCEQAGTGKAWEGAVEVTAGAPVHVRAALLGELAVTFAIDAQLDGHLHHRGETIRVPAGRHHLATPATSGWRDLRGACTIRDTPELDCY
jgi:serine/threonine-protein kinase